MHLQHVHCRATVEVWDRDRDRVSGGVRVRVRARRLESYIDFSH